MLPAPERGRFQAGDSVRCRVVKAGVLTSGADCLEPHSPVPVRVAAIIRKILYGRKISFLPFFRRAAPVGRMETRNALSAPDGVFIRGFPFERKEVAGRSPLYLVATAAPGVVACGLLY